MRNDVWCATIVPWENQRIKAATLHTRRAINPPNVRKEGDTMITYSELIQFGIFIVALVSLICQIFRDRKK